MHGQITCDVVMEQFRKVAPKREFSFRTELVDGQTTLFEVNQARRSRKRAEMQVKCDEQTTFSPAFSATFERNPFSEIGRDRPATLPLCARDIQRSKDSPHGPCHP
jgi:hypothetical protein